MTDSKELCNPQDDAPVIKKNPLFLDEDAEPCGSKLVSTLISNPPVHLVISWNPKYVFKIEIRTLSKPITVGAVCINSDTDRSLPSFQSESQSSSDIDEDLFEMSQIPALPEPKMMTHPLVLIPDKMIKDLSIRLANSRERTLLTNTLAKSDRFNSSYPSSSFGDVQVPCSTVVDMPAPNFKNPSPESSAMLPILRELESMLSNSRTINTFKAKVQEKRERLDGERSSLNTSASDDLNTPKPSGRLKNLYKRKRRIFQALTALLLLILFLAMLVGLSMCCSNKPSNTKKT